MALDLKYVLSYYGASMKSSALQDGIRSDRSESEVGKAVTKGKQSIEEFSALSRYYQQNHCVNFTLKLELVKYLYEQESAVR